MLIICPTPIGNLGDASPRQIEALSQADIIACEDTRRTGKLLEHLGIGRPQGRPKLVRYDDHTAEQQVGPLLHSIKEGKRVVLVSDAGTPTISDPGYRLVRAAREAAVEVVALPGPVAAVVALSGSGLASDRFFFEGFLPTSKKERLSRLAELFKLATTVVAYESPYRIVDALRDVEEVFGPDHRVCVARELSKLHEEYLIGKAEVVRADLESREGARGEFVLCLSPAVKAEEQQSNWAEAERAIAIMLEKGARARTIKDVVSELYDVPRSQVYERIEALKKE